MRFRLITLFLFFSFASKGQICNFCSELEVKDFLRENFIEFSESKSPSGEKIISNDTENFHKTYYFRYDKCFLFRVETSNLKFQKHLLHHLDRNYKATSDTTWEDLENRVEFTTKGGSFEFDFYPKVSIDTSKKDLTD